MDPTPAPNSTPEWWEEFFASPDCLPLSFFPTPRETRQEVAALERILGLRPGLRIADICCGEGRHLLPLLRRGYDLTGLDVSPWLLQRAREAAHRERLPVRLVRGDARRLPFRDGSFQVVMNLFNSFGYCEREEDNYSILAETARCLAPGGQFLLDTRNAQYQILFAPVRRAVVGAGGVELVQSCRYDRDRHRLSILWEDAEGRVVHRAGFRLYQLEELRAMIARVGLEEVGVYGGYEGAAFDGYERILILHAEKPA